MNSNLVIEPAFVSVARLKAARGARIATSFSCALVLAFATACSGGSSTAPVDEAAYVQAWSQVAIDASGLDHTPSSQGPAHTFGQQLGPCRASRAMAIVHLAIFEVVNAIDRRYQSYANVLPALPGTSLRAAVAQTAHDTLKTLFPSQTDLFDARLADELAQIPAGTAKDQGITLGTGTARVVLTLRQNDGSDQAEPHMNTDYVPGNQPGEWRQDPVSLHPLALGALWSTVTPFVMTSASQFRCDPPPALNTPEYALAYDEARVLGGDGVVTPTLRSEEETFVGTFWAYDGTPSLCAPPRFYNQIATKIALEHGASVTELARLLALVNVAMADAGISAWEAKYFYKFWRPVAGVREADPGTGPTGLGDGNPETVCEPTFLPLGAPASNLAGPNITPPFPTYPSGHATFGGALFQVLRRFYGTDAIEFTIVSDEFNGQTVDNQGNVRPYRPRTFTSLSQAEEENGQSRIYLGIHWAFDKTSGIGEGNAVGDFVFDNAFQPLP